MMTMLSKPRLQRVADELGQDGVAGLLKWSARWMYWNAKMYRLPFKLRTRIESYFRPPITPWSLQWFQEHPEYPIQLLSAPQKFTIDPPKTLESTVFSGFMARTKYSVNARFVAAIPRSEIVGQDGLVVLPDSSFAAEIANGAQNLTADTDYLTFSRHTRRIPKAGKHFSFLMKWCRSGNYYHWIHDILLKSYPVLDMLPPDAKFIVPTDLSPFQHETLRLMGIRPEQLEYFDGKGVLVLEEHYFSPPVTWSGYDSAAANVWLRDKIFANCNIVSPKSTRRIFISRARAQHRRILNEQPMLSFLEPLGFQKYLLEEMSFREQVELFSQAEIVVGQHGAGLTNVLFSPPGCLVVEFFAPAHFKLGYWSYWMTSKTMGHDYWYVLCEGVANPSAPPNCDDLIVPIEKLERTLKSAGTNLS